MGKAAMCIRMLQYLNTGRIYKVSELAELLGTNPRNVVEYKKELDEVASENNYDFDIENLPGRYGGYRINGEAIIPSLGLSHDEKNSLTEALNYLLARNDFLM
jgi:predicted DNA-binding transcriptional regulator YafY